MENESSQTTLRDSIAAAFDAAEAGSNTNVEAPLEQAAQANEAPEASQPDAPQSESAADKASRERDELGRFASKKEEQQPQQPQVAQSDVNQPQEAAIPRPTTWKKEYAPIWDKLARGDALTAQESQKLAKYNVQREQEFATGVSTYRQEAQNAKHLTEALAPFIPVMQRRNMSAPDFIKNLGTTYAFLAEGSVQQKLQAFAALARDVGIPLEAIGQAQTNQLNPVVPQLLQEIQELKSQINGVNGWRDQQEQSEIQKVISEFENNPESYPHFQTVRQTMGKMLESGFANNMQDAYTKAVRMHDDIWQEEQEKNAAQLLAQQAAPAVDKAALAAQAKAKVLSPRQASPSGATKAIDPKNLRSVLENAFDSHTGTGRV